MLIFRKQDKKYQFLFFEKKIINVKKKTVKKINLDENFYCHMFIHLIIIQIEHDKK